MPSRPVAHKILIGLRILALAPAFAIGLPAQWLAVRFGSGLARTLPVIFHRYVLLVLGVKVERSGRMDPARPLLLVSNHLSWLDILVLSSLAPLSFIAKSEVAGWPVFGTLARLQRSVFVERARRGRTADVNREIAHRLESGDAMVLFAEGTTSDGLRILPFRSALLGAAQAAAGGSDGTSRVQPVDIAYPRIGGLRATREDLPVIAWYGDMELVPHLADFFALGGVTARVSFGEARVIGAGNGRKALTQSLESEVRRLHRAAMRGE